MAKKITHGSLSFTEGGARKRVGLDFDEAELAKLANDLGSSCSQATRKGGLPSARRTVEDNQTVERQVRTVYFISKGEVQDRLR